MTLTCYLAGPMRGLPEGNIPAFRLAAEELRKMGYVIISPAEMDSPETLADTMKGVEMAEYGGKKPGAILAEDVEVIHDKVGGIVFLDGWEKSRGARIEAFVGLTADKQFFRYSYPYVWPIDKETVRDALRRNMP